MGVETLADLPEFRGRFDGNHPVSTGSESCWLTAATNSAGSTQHATTNSRTRHWDSSFTSSNR
ncbi:hypothetical protein ACFQ1S_38305 [Kibdelosporangium lantanae]|uniref:Uncharacterized protein n=1 Tax=Kibdelosporangium lantanae TaxID=1497396 RepID=A0ABW3MK47_9PSEU